MNSLFLVYNVQYRNCVQSTDKKRKEKRVVHVFMLSANHGAATRGVGGRTTCLKFESDFRDLRRVCRRGFVEVSLNEESSLMADLLGTQQSATHNGESGKMSHFPNLLGFKRTCPAWSAAVLSDILRHAGVRVPRHKNIFLFNI